jgi:hypothetical protein
MLKPLLNDNSKFSIAETKTFTTKGFKLISAELMTARPIMVARSQGLNPDR